MSDTKVYQVRFAAMADAEAIARVHAAASEAAYRGLLPQSHFDALAPDKRKAFWREAIDLGEPQLLVACEGREVAGFAGFDRSRDKGTPPSTGELWSFYVAPDRWGTGCGLALWDAAREGLQEEGCTKATLWVPLANQRALRFFELAGFKRELSSAKTLPVGGVKVEEIRLSRSIA